ncbi:apolipoprotein L6-like [Heterodontus francisci]|uniref:apolipoprotein L6-like n=1 Tax=Heterodontus francisci TaxID=7792 RepID=UPI00355C20CF
MSHGRARFQDGASFQPNTTKGLLEDAGVTAAEDHPSSQDDPDSRETSLTQMPKKHSDYCKEDGEPIPEELWEQLKTELEKRAEDCRSFVKQFPDWRDQIRGYIKELQEIADSVDEYHRSSTIASVTGASAAVVGGALSLSGIIASPFTSGASLGLTAVGAGVSATGAATNFTAGVTENVAQSNKQKRVDEIIEQYNNRCKEMAKYLHEVCSAIKSWSHNLRAEIMRHKPSEEMSDFLNEACSAANCSEGDGEDSVTGKPRSLSVSSTERQEIAASQKTANIKELLSGSFPLLSAFAKAISAILTAILMITNIYSITKNSIDLSKGSKTEVAKNIQGVAMKMGDELMAYEDIYEFLKLILKID